MSETIELGLDTFGDVTDAAHGGSTTYAQVIRDVVEEAVLADQLGVDFIGIGEHHRDDFAISSPEMVLAAIAGATSRIRLGSAVTVMSSDDPVRVFQRFATLDAVSGGRAEVILGRGSFTESFPLFGDDLGDYEILFEEKVNLFVHLLREQPVTWQGSTRAPLTDQLVYPTTEHGHLTTWIGVGGSPTSVARAAHYRLPLMVAIIGGEPHRFRPLVDLYREAGRRAGHPEAQLKVGIHCPGYVGETTQQAADDFFPGFAKMFTEIGKERGFPPTTRAHFDAQRGPTGAFFIGDVETVAKKMVSVSKALGGLSRITLQMTNVMLPHEKMLKGIGLLGRVRGSLQGQ